MRMTLVAALLALATSPAFAAGSDDSTPPRPTETTEVCKDGKVWDARTKSCVAPKDARLDDETRYAAARELAYAGRYKGAEAVLDAMSDQNAGNVLTYRGFLARKRGDWAGAETFYAAALAAEPDNVLARSYLGQGLLANGDEAGAAAQLSEIRARGGRNTWAEEALAMALSGRNAPAY